MLSNVFIIIQLEGPLDYYLEDFWCVVTTFQRDLQNGLTLLIKFHNAILLNFLPG